VDDGSILERDDVLGANTPPWLALPGFVTVTFVFDMLISATQSRSAGDDVAWVLAAAARAQDVGSMFALAAAIKVSRWPCFLICFGAGNGRQPQA
jgi:hypothetical protein